MAQQQVSSSQKALMLELKGLQEEPVEGFRITLVDESDLYNWEVAIFGPPNTLYEGGYFKVRGSAPQAGPAPTGGATRAGLAREGGGWGRGETPSLEGDPRAGGLPPHFGEGAPCRGGSSLGAPPQTRAWHPAFS
ncbi:Ubiquitin conjugating enzyme E2 R2 [Crotalus adamanteus]|uniref:Ubiquitin conjugating enzyme E2 R2 n=1 Tax=Crotalus adamanteus TaxID=8729 RepID=A0AAW1C4W7_CROAD